MTAGYRARRGRRVGPQEKGRRQAAEQPAQLMLKRLETHDTFLANLDRRRERAVFSRE